MNAEQLKNSILQYAFQGKLVNSKDISENATKLVEAIIEERNQLIKEKIIKKVKVSAIKDTDHLWDIPDHWVWERAANVLDVRDGTHDTPKYVSEGIPLVTSKNLKNGEISFESAKFISMEDHLAIEQRSKVDNDDILFAMIGTIGNPVLVKKDRDFSVKNVGIFKSYPVNKVNMKYILYFLIYMENILKKNASGGVQAFISLSGLRNIMIPIAPIKEQNEIVSKIEELIEKVNRYDELFVQLEKHNVNFPNNLEKSILQYAMQGKLVEQDPSDEPAQKLIEKIKVEKERLIKDKLIKKVKPLPLIAEEEIPFDIPSTWEWVRLGEICEINPKNSAEDEIDVGFIPMKLIQDGAVNNHTFEERKWKDIKKGFTHFKENDIVVAKITPCFENRKSAIVKGLPNGIGAGTTELYVFRPYSGFINSEYLLWIFKSQNFIEGGKNSFSGTAGQQRVSKSYIENYLIPLPPYKEQKRIVKKILEFTSVLTKLTK